MIINKTLNFLKILILPKEFIHLNQSVKILFIEYFLTTHILVISFLTWLFYFSTSIHLLKNWSFLPAWGLTHNWQLILEFGLFIFYFGFCFSLMFIHLNFIRAIHSIIYRKKTIQKILKNLVLSNITFLLLILGFHLFYILIEHHQTGVTFCSCRYIPTIN